MFKKIPLEGSAINGNDLLNMMMSTLMQFQGHKESIQGTPIENKKEAPHIFEQSTNFPIAQHIYFCRAISFTGNIQKSAFWQRHDL